MTERTRSRAPSALGRVALGTATVAVVAIAACGGGGTERGTDARSVFDDAAGLIDRHYAFFTTFAIDWPTVVARAGSRVTATSNDAELRAAICGLVDAMRSYHAGLTTPSGSCSYASAPTYPAGYVASLAERALAAPRLTTSGRMRYARLTVEASGGAASSGAAIGYVRIGSFEGDGWGTDIDEALTTLADVHALIVDVRANGGGNEGVARQVASRFADRERTYRLSRTRSGDAHTDLTTATAVTLAPAGRRFTLPVAVLTDRGMHSAAEDFTMMMRVLPTVVTVGDTTFGTSSNPREERLANGWTLRIPQSIQTTPDGLVVEGRGLPPSVAVRLTADDQARGVDTILARAVAELRARF